jgi:hypothetical protein
LIRIFAHHAVYALKYALLMQLRQLISAALNISKQPEQHFFFRSAEPFPAYSLISFFQPGYASARVHVQRTCVIGSPRFP